jgi:hypothetical protein
MHFIFNSDDCDIAISNYLLSNKIENQVNLSSFLISEKYITVKNKCLEWLDECIRLKKTEEFTISIPQFSENDDEKKRSNYLHLGCLLWKNCIDYQVCFTKLGLANLEAYIFRKVYEAKTDSNIVKISKEDNGLFLTQIYFGKNEQECYSIDSEKFWINFAKEITSKLGNVEFLLITHDYVSDGFLQTNSESVFNINLECYYMAEEPWFVIRDDTFYFDGIEVKTIGNNENKLLDIDSYIDQKWEESYLYPNNWNGSKSFIEGLEALQISYNKILSGTVKKLPSKNDWESFY